MLLREGSINLNNETEDLVVIALPGYDPEIGRWLWALEDTRRDTIKCLDGLTDEDLDALPQGADNRIGALLYHIAMVEVGWLFFQVLEGNKPFPQGFGALFPVDALDEQEQLANLQGASLQDYLKRLEKVRATLMEEFLTMSIEDFRRIRHLPEENVTPEWVLHHLIQHEAEHRGHIQTVRHLLGK
jgi:uncharacterized damage-inducible protein DinB